MTDWLDPLIRDKGAAVRKKQTTEQAELEKRDRETQAKLQAAIEIQKRILGILAESHIESLILELVNKVVAGHPQYPNASLGRKILLSDGRYDLKYSGSLFGPSFQMSLTKPDQEVNPLPEVPESQQGFFAKISWTLSLSTDPIDESKYSWKHIDVIITADSLEINKMEVRPLTTKNVQKSLLKSFQKPLSTTYVPSYDYGP